MVLDVERDGKPLQVRFVLQTVAREADITISLALLAMVVPFSILLGFGVTWLRPNDVRSWILLALLISFLPMFNLVYVPSTSRLIYYHHRLMQSSVMNTWPVWMGLLGIFFPDRLPFTRFRRIAFSLAVVPNIVLTLPIVVYELACVEMLPVARAMYPMMEALLTPVRFAHMASIGFFFAAIGIQRGIASTPEAKRRAALVNWGAHISMTPMFLLVLRSVVLRTDVFYGVPGLAIVGALAFLTLFPLTLAYVVIVHRALDVKVVLRTGLQYALASRAVRVVQVAISFALIFNAGRLIEKGENRPQRIMLICAAILGVALLRLIAERLKAWVDRRFFREAYNAEHVLSELSDEVRTIVETQPLLDTVSRRISEALHVSRVAMLTRDNGAFRPAFAIGYDAPPEATLPAASAVISRIKDERNGLTVYLDDPDSWAHRDLPAAEQQCLQALQSQLLLPLAAKEELLGVISLGPKRSEEPYSRGDLQLLRSVAAQTGLALENTRLASAFAEQAAQRERLHREMEIARDVQTRLFPQKLPAVAGIEYSGACRPAQSVGGDYYDFFETPNKQFGVAIGDVSGKGVPAALLMAVLHASVRGQAIHTGEDLATLIGHVNRLIYDASAKSHFATLFYAQYDPASRRLVYVNAGHNPPLILRASGETEWLKATGPGTGLTRLSRYTHRDLQLQPGDILIAYTDGLSEAMNLQQEEFGEERLLTASRQVSSLTAPDAIRLLFDTVDQFAGAAPQHDDMTAVIVRLQP